MTDIVDVPAPVVVPPYPEIGQEGFGRMAYDVGTEMPNVVANINETAQSARTNALAAQEQAQTAVQAASAAAAVQEIVLGASHFVDEWQRMSGTLAKPASVKHRGQFWLLLQNVDAVESEEPGVSEAWTSLQATTIVQEVAASTEMVPGVRYVVTAPGVTLTVPAAVSAGDTFAAVGATHKPDIANPATWVAVSFFVDWRGYTVKGQEVENPMLVRALASFSVTFTGSTFA